MILNLSDVLSEQHKAIHESVPIEMTCFKSEMGDYAITEKTPLELSVEYAGDRKLEVTGKAEITSVAPCDRCLEDVEVKVTLDFKHKIDTESDAYDQSEDLFFGQIDIGYTSLKFLNTSRITDILGSSPVSSQLQVPLFRF